MVGRDRELGHLLDRWEEVQDGRGQVVDLVRERVAPVVAVDEKPAQPVEGAAGFLAGGDVKFDAVARGEVGELIELHARREVLELCSELLLMQRELGERFAAVLPPRDADET